MISIAANDSIAHLYIQKDPIIIRNQQRRRFKRLRFKQTEPDQKLEHGETMSEYEGCASQNKMEQIEEKNPEIVSDEQEDKRAMEEDCNNFKVQLARSEEKLKISENLYERHTMESEEKMKKFEEQIKSLQNKINDLEDHNKRLKEENVENIGEKNSKIAEQNKIIEDLTKANISSTNEIQNLNSLLIKEKERNEKFTNPISSQV